MKTCLYTDILPGFTKFAVEKLEKEGIFTMSEFCNRETSELQYSTRMTHRCIEGLETYRHDNLSVFSYL